MVGMLLLRYRETPQAYAWIRMDAELAGRWLHLNPKANRHEMKQGSKLCLFRFVQHELYPVFIIFIFTQSFSYNIPVKLQMPVKNTGLEFKHNIRVYRKGERSHKADAAGTDVKDAYFRAFRINAIFLDLNDRHVCAQRLLEHVPKVLPFIMVHMHLLIHSRLAFILNILSYRGNSLYYLF